MPTARREPPPFRRVAVRRVEGRSPRLLCVTLAGAELAGLTVDQPAASVRLLIPSSGTGDLAMPAWNGNEFLLPDGRRPTIRTLTPFRIDAESRELDVEIVVHDGGALSAWAEAAALQRIRRHLFDERGLSRTTASVRGYWKEGRSGDADVDG